ncbi:MAG: ATPase [Saprospiraceae bacterium]|nr:ATPase [Saprospiraceae bacterium]
MTFLCISNYFKGMDFLRTCFDASCKVYLVTSEKTREENWPKECIEDIFFVEDIGEQGDWDMEALTRGTAYFLRQVRVDRIVALDDFDVEKAAHLREEFRIPGMGTTTGRYFRDKLAMRVKAREDGIPIPDFSNTFNDADLNDFIDRNPGPCVVKPRSAAAAAGITKVKDQQSYWETIHGLGDDRHRYLVEAFKPGEVYHVDSLTLDGKVIFSRVSRYISTPMEVAQGGGVFRSHTVPFGGDEDIALQALNEKVLKAFGMNFSASHTEFIRSKETGEYYFLETSSRVGGAHLAEMVEASSGINLWNEWAKIEISKARGTDYKLPPVRNDHAGIVVSLSRFEHPDSSSFQDPEIVWRLDKPYHIGLILQSPDREKILELLDKYGNRILSEFHASV